MKRGHLVADNKLAVVVHHLDAVVLDVVAGEDALQGLHSHLRQSLGTSVDVSNNVASELLGLGVESGSAGDRQGVRNVVGGHDRPLIHLYKNNHKYILQIFYLYFHEYLN